MKKWTNEEIEFLKGNYETMTQPEIGKMLGRGRGSIDKQCRLLGLTKSRIKVKIGDAFGFLTVQRIYQGCKPNGQLETWCECICHNPKMHAEDNIANVRAKNLGSGTQSCGCLILQMAAKRLTTHGLCAAGHKPLINVLRHMHDRCYNEDCDNYEYYGAKGIIIADEWNFNIVGYEQACRNFIEWSLANGYKKGLTINRIKCGNYGPMSCEWITYEKQGADKTNNRYLTVDDETKLQIEWMKDERVTVSISTVNKRLKNNWPDKEALFTPGKDIKSGTCKHSEEEVKRAFELKGQGLCFAEIGRELNIEAATAAAFLTGKTRKKLYNKYKHLLENKEAPEE